MTLEQIRNASAFEAFIREQRRRIAMAVTIPRGFIHNHGA